MIEPKNVENECNVVTGVQKFSREKHPLHPLPVAGYTPSKDLGTPGNSSSERYGELNNDSPIGAYAWEFLRRNRFYQAMQDKAEFQTSLEIWGYRPHPTRPASYGLAEPKPYDEPYSPGAVDAPDWLPIRALSDRFIESLKDGRQQQPVQLEYPDSQVAFVFDLAATFGPSGICLDKQIELASRHLQQLIEYRQEHNIDAATIEESAFVVDDKAKLRKYLQVADVLSLPQRIRPNDWDIPTGMRYVTTIREAASLLPDHIFSNAKKSELISPEQKVDRTRGLVEKAYAYIYEWKLLNLLASFNPRIPEVRFPRKKPENDADPQL